MTEAPTPEVAAYQGAKEEMAAYGRRIWRRVAVVLGAYSLVATAAVGYTAVTAHQIRSAQVANTEVTEHRDTCDQTSNRDLAFDLRYIFIVPKGISLKKFEAGFKFPSAKC